MNYKFKNTFPFNDRKRDSQKIMDSNPERIPVICERSDLAPADCPYIDKKKYLVPRDLTVGQFIYFIRNRMKLSPEKGLYLFINGTIPTTSYPMSFIYDFYKDADCYLYILYTFENTFG